MKYKLKKRILYFIMLNYVMLYILYMLVFTKFKLMRQHSAQATFCRLWQLG